MNILEEIIANKHREVESKKAKLEINELIARSKDVNFNSFYTAIKDKVQKKEAALIAEVKKASPSKGIIKKDFNPVQIAKSYSSGGATCLSVLTDEKYFKGNLQYLQEVKKETNLPILRKDFIIDEYQIFESIVNKSDCLLLIVAALEKDKLKELFEKSIENGIDVLIEVHDKKEMETCLEIVENLNEQYLVGINNRDLKTFNTSLETTRNLVNYYKNDLENKIVVSESGINNSNDIAYLQELGVFSYLVGESLVKNNNIEKATKELLIHN